MKEVITVIIPVYNAAPYITQCIESLVRQKQKLQLPLKLLPALQKKLPKPSRLSHRNFMLLKAACAAAISSSPPVNRRIPFSPPSAVCAVKWKAPRSRRSAV